MNGKETRSVFKARQDLPKISPKKVIEAMDTIISIISSPVILSVPVKCETRKLKVSWTPELKQDLEYWYGMDLRLPTVFIKGRLVDPNIKNFF